METPRLKQLKSSLTEKILKGLQEGNEEILSLYKNMVGSAVNLIHKDLKHLERLVIDVLSTI